MRRIAVVSMVRNEADVIESFVRHCLSFADFMLVVDHMSVDDTGGILQALAQEGLPVMVRRFEDVEQSQSEVMTALARQAFLEEGADLVLPLDADEFLVPEDGISCRAILEQLAVDRVYSLDWVRYLLAEPEAGQDVFLLARPAWRSRQAERLKKIVVGREAFVRTGLEISQGNHVACIKNEAGEQALVPERIAGLHLAHYSWRSEAQACSKAAVGWLANLAKYSPYTNMANHWRKDFDCLLHGEGLKPQPLMEPLPVRWSGLMVSLRYTRKRGDAFVTLLQAAEHMAEAYAAQKVLNRRAIVSCLIPFDGDAAAFRASVASVEAQSYPYYELFSFSVVAETAMWDEVCQESAGRIIQLRRTAGEYPLQLAAQVNGAYVQWVMPGDVLQPDRFMKMVESLEPQPNITFALSLDGCADARGLLRRLDLQAALDTGDERFVLGDGDEIWFYLLGQGKVLGGGISSVLFRRQTMDDCAWLKDCFMDDRLMLLSFWGKVLPGAVIGSFAESLVRVSTRNMSVDDVVWLQMEWFYLLQEHMSDRGMSSASWQLFRQRQRKLTGIVPQASEIVQRAYQQVMQQVEV